MKSQNLIVGMDLTEHGERALATALRLARQMTDATVHIAHAITRDELASPGEAMERQDQALGRVPREIWRAVDKVMTQEKVGVQEVDIWQHVRLGKPVDVVRQVAADYDAALVIVGTANKKGVEKLVLGSVAEKLTRDGRFPVLVAHPNRLAEIPKTVFPDEAQPFDADIQPRPESAHVYRSSAIDAWKGLGRATSTEFK